MSAKIERKLIRQLEKMKRLTAIFRGEAQMKFKRGPKRKRYVLGNCIRSYFEGRFESVDEAWKWLSRRFLIAYPSRSGRNVFMQVEMKTEFDDKVWLPARDGITWRGSFPRKSVIRRCHYSNESF